ncbi:MAG: 30S ribosomal protein S18 [Candidatus Levybacteria bacterium RIFCSPLOWO2_01_FULL_38_13]|nr:MAG: 30S ribosomal protein S18 [Candidatus Levybacteria bacterium RIFCSPHIGHO2_01_FULL_41_15]OGH35104.1 MAG: 30S ribosomal protein S18 [Candidatus Levybacteria bacterium RIFCSPLOWO2_01_FULL_38_13]
MVKKRRQIRKIRVKESCYFCKEGKEPTVRDVSVLRRYLTERNKIISRARTGICAKHQRNLTKSIKHARHLALLPFIAKEI